MKIKQGPEVNICNLCCSLTENLISFQKLPVKPDQVWPSPQSLVLTLVLRKTEQRAHTHTHFPLPASWPLNLALWLNPMPGRLMAGGNTKGLFTPGGSVQGEITPPPHTITTLHTPTSLTICWPVAACRVRKPLRLIHCIAARDRYRDARR